MRIGINATCFNNRPSGARQRFIGIYSRVVHRLPDTEFVVYEPSDCRVGSWFRGANNVSVRRTPLPSEGRLGKLRGASYWHSAIQAEGLDLFESYNLPLPNIPVRRQLLTIHDIRRLKLECPWHEKILYKRILEKSLRAADHVITVSETMKEEILAFYPKTSISVIYNGLNASKFNQISEADLGRARDTLALPESFILAVGHLEKRKNYQRLIDAMALLHDGGHDYSLVIIGNDNGERHAIEAKVRALNLGDKVKILSGIDDLELRCAYKLCQLFVFPSSYEGFGIPILEAMAAGRPMVLSDTKVFREITQNKGIYFPCGDSIAMAKAIRQGLEIHAERVRLVEYGKRRILDFSFEHIASQVELLYQKFT